MLSVRRLGQLVVVALPQRHLRQLPDFAAKKRAASDAAAHHRQSASGATPREEGSGLFRLRTGSVAGGFDDRSAAPAFTSVGDLAYNLRPCTAVACRVLVAVVSCA